MKRVAVISSNLAEVGYDPDTQTLEILFKKGGVYQYFGVSPIIHEGLIAASSPGGFFDTNVKKAGYRALRVAD